MLSPIRLVTEPPRPPAVPKSNKDGDESVIDGSRMDAARSWTVEDERCSGDDDASCMLNFVFVYKRLGV